MNELDDHYKMLLNVGFIVLREASQYQSPGWVEAEIEMLHNVPSLIGETNLHRHRYYWDKERIAYIDWITKFGSAHAKSRMAVFYEPIWDSIGKLLNSSPDPKVGAEVIATT